MIYTVIYMGIESDRVQSTCIDSKWKYFILERGCSNLSSRSLSRWFSYM